jgi:hypothetical protein
MFSYCIVLKVDTDVSDKHGASILQITQGEDVGSSYRQAARHVVNQIHARRRGGRNWSGPQSIVIRKTASCFELQVYD